MGPAQAIKTNLAKSFQFSGRASRSEFWWFGAAWFVVMVILVTFVGWTHERLPASRSAIIAWKTVEALCIFGFFAPLSTIARRHHDLGFPASLPLLASIVGLVLLYGATAFVPLLLGVHPLFALPLLLRNSDFLLLFTSLIALSAVIAGWPSQPTPNRYGPPPSEVTP